jgi:hypothetical protein
MIAIVAAIVVLLLLFGRKASASTSTGVIQGDGPDFDPLTASQLGGRGAVRGGVTVGDDWSATFITGNGNWADEYRSRASSDDNDEPGGIPL